MTYYPLSDSPGLFRFLPNEICLSVFGRLSVQDFIRFGTTSHKAYDFVHSEEKTIDSIWKCIHYLTFVNRQFHLMEEYDEYLDIAKKNFYSNKKRRRGNVSGWRGFATTSLRAYSQIMKRYVKQDEDFPYSAFGYCTGQYLVIPCLEMIAEREDDFLGRVNKPKDLLYDACKSGVHDVVKKLLDLGLSGLVSRNICDWNDKKGSPMTIAAGNGHTQTLSVIFEHKGNLEGLPEDYGSLQAIFFAVLKSAKSDLVRDIINHVENLKKTIPSMNKKCISRDAYKQRYPFMLAIENDDAETLMILLQNGVVWTEEFYKSKKNLVDISITEGSVKCLRLLANFDSSVFDYIQKPRYESLSFPLELAFRHTYMAIAEWLITNGAFVDAVNSENLTALQCLLKSKAEIVNGVALLEFEKRLPELTENIPQDRFIETTYHSRNIFTKCFNCPISQIKYLMEADKEAGFDRRDIIHMLCETLPKRTWMFDHIRFKTILDLLIENYQVIDLNYQSPLHENATPLIIASSRNVESLETLLEYDIDVQLVDNVGNTALHKMIKGFRYYCDENMIHKLIERGADINAQNFEGDTIFTQQISPELLEVLFDNNADMTIKNNKGETVYHYNCYDISTTFKLFEEGKPDVSVLSGRTTEGYTFLHFILNHFPYDPYYYSTTIPYYVSKLYQIGYDFDQEDADGFNIIQYIGSIDTTYYTTLKECIQRGESFAEQYLSRFYEYYSNNDSFGFIWDLVQEFNLR
eukprot:TRINITY_DN12362_c0_g1_i1.p1 TRINITY_DN12362_c0_g1~~TRINITY_DN12362_c0_g1_i1.p1  ORF type:complete len:747 (+),score=158.59 TRINITY_DN12362_c0_g1_i1:162-2402(+)